MAKSLDWSNYVHILDLNLASLNNNQELIVAGVYSVVNQIERR
jgi:hypothetical protein